MQLQPARWDKSQLPASDDDDGPVQPRSRPSSPSERSDRSSASPRSLPPRMRLKENKSPFEFRVIKQASATPSQSSSTASTDRELVPIPSPPWAKNKPLPSEDQPAEGPAEESNLSSNHYIPKASSNRYYRQLPSPSSSSLPPFRSLDTRSPPPEGSFPPTASTSRRHSPPLSPRHPYRASQLETAPSASTSSSKPYHPYYRSQSFDYPPPPPQPMRHRSYHHLPSLSSPSPSTGQKRRYASGDEDSQVRGRRMDVDTNNREPGMNIDKRRKEDLEREKALRTLPPLPPFRRGQQGGHRLVSYPSHSPPSSAPPPLGQSRNEHYYANPLRDTPAPPPPPPRSYSEYTSPSYPQPEYLPLASGPYPPPPSTHSNILPPPANYPAPYRPPPPEQQPHFPYPPSYPPYPPPRAYGLPPPPPQPPQQAPSRLQPPPPKKHPPFPPNRNGISKAKANAPPPPPPPPHSQLLPSSTPYSYFHKIRLNRPKQSRSSTAASSSQHQPPPQAQEMQDDQTLYQQAAAARHAAYSSPDTVDSTTLTTYPVPYSIGVKAASSTAGMAGDAGRLVGEYEQHPLRQQTSYLPISAVGGAQFVLKPPRIRKTKSSKLKFMVSGSSATPTFPLTPASQFSEVIQTNGADVGDNFIESVVEPRPFRPNPEDVLIEIKQEEENVAASVAAITIAESHEPLVAPDGEDELATPAFDDGIAKEFNDNDMGGSTVVLSLGSPTDFMNSETNTFAAPARPSRTVKKYPCDICGQIFTRSGDVKRHKESRHRESAGCICPYCGRILTRQDALQRHWDKYCRKKNKRMDRRRRFGLSFDPGIDVDPGLLHPAPRHEGNQASLGGSNGIDIRSFRTNRSKTFGRGRRNNGKQKARTHRDGDGDVRMLSGSESESEVDELESEDPLDGYDSEEEEKRRDRGNLQGTGKDKDKEIDELNESEDNEREDGVKSDAEGVSVNGDDFYTISGESEDESEEEGGMDARPDAEPIMEGLTRSPLEVVEEPEPFSHTAFKRPILESPKQGLAPDPKILPQSPPAKDEAVKSPTPMNTSPHLSNFRQASSLSFVEFRPPPPSSTVQSVPSKPRSAPAAPTNSGPAPMSAFTSTFPAQPPHLRQPRARAEYRVRYNAPMLPPQQPTLSPPRHGLPVVRSDSLSVQVHVPPSNLSARIRRGPKPRRTDFDAVLDPSQTAAQGGQIRMRVLPQATHTPPVQPALAIMHEQPHVTKRKGKRVDGLVPEYGFVPREYVYRERE